MFMLRSPRLSLRSNLGLKLANAFGVIGVDFDVCGLYLRDQRVQSLM